MEQIKTEQQPLPVLSAVAAAYVTEFDAGHAPSGRFTLADPTTYGPDGYAWKQYRDGYALACKGASIFIAVNGSWSAVIPPQPDHLPGQTRPSYLTAYEVVGNHACTAALIQGWIDGDAPIVDYRDPAHPPFLSEDTLRNQPLLTRDRDFLPEKEWNT